MTIQLHSAHGPLYRPISPYNPGVVYLHLPGCARACAGSSRPRTRAKPPEQIEFNLRLRRLGRRATTMTIHDHSAHGPLCRPMSPYSHGEVYLRLPDCARTCAGSSRPRTRAKPPPQIEFAIEEAQQKSYDHDHSAHGPLCRPMSPYSPGEVYLRLPGCARTCAGSSRPRTRAKPPPQIEICD